MFQNDKTDSDKKKDNNTAKKCRYVIASINLSVYLHIQKRLVRPTLGSRYAMKNHANIDIQKFVNVARYRVM